MTNSSKTKARRELEKQLKALEKLVALAATAEDVPNKRKGHKS